MSRVDRLAKHDDLLPKLVFYIKGMLGLYWGYVGIILGLISELCWGYIGVSVFQDLLELRVQRSGGSRVGFFVMLPPSGWGLITGLVELLLFIVVAGTAKGNDPPWGLSVGFEGLQQTCKGFLEVGD